MFVVLLVLSIMFFPLSYFVYSQFYFVDNSSLLDILAQSWVIYELGSAQLGRHSEAIRSWLRASSRFSALESEQQQQQQQQQSGSGSGFLSAVSRRESFQPQSRPAVAPFPRNQLVWPPPQTPSENSSRPDSSEISRSLNGSVTDNALQRPDVTSPAPPPVQKRPPSQPPRPKRINSTIASANVPDKSTQQPAISGTGTTTNGLSSTLTNPPNGNASSASEDASSSRRGLVASRKQLFESLRE